ncbi:MAG: PDZ domain-containing protein [Pirellulales bacterium]|nr:PDZ domain-containing protein [Pirellulales bacterium]
MTDEIARKLGLNSGQGVFVTQVQKNTPAEKAGIVMGDVILSWNGIEYSAPTLMSRAIAATEIGADVPVEIMRYGRNGPEKITLQVKVAARPRDSL